MQIDHALALFTAYWERVYRSIVWSKDALRAPHHAHEFTTTHKQLNENSLFYCTGALLPFTKTILSFYLLSGRVLVD